MHSNSNFVGVYDLISGLINIILFRNKHRNWCYYFWHWHQSHNFLFLKAPVNGGACNIVLTHSEDWRMQESVKFYRDLLNWMLCRQGTYFICYVKFIALGLWMMNYDLVKSLMRVILTEAVKSVTKIQSMTYDKIIASCLPVNPLPH